MPSVPVLRAAVLLGCSCAFAAPTLAQRVAIVRTNLPGAVAYADTVRVGLPGAGVLSIPAGARTLRLVAPDGDWSIRPVEAALPFPSAGADTIRLQLDFPYHYRVESVPFGATVVHEAPGGARVVLGVTPLVVVREGPLEGTIVVGRDGYAASGIVPGREVWNRHAVLLASSAGRGGGEGGQRVRYRASRRWIDYAAVGVALAASAVSIAYKFEADRTYARYSEPVRGGAANPDYNDLAFKRDAERLDVKAGVALGVAQAGLGVFALRLVLRR